MSKVTEQIASEYDIVRKGGAGLIDLSSRGRMRVSGTEVVLFLNGLITNDMKTLLEEQWMPAVFPTVQGRFIAVVRVWRFNDEQNEKSSVSGFMLDTEASTRQVVLQNISRFTMAGDFRVQDVSDQTAMLSIQGQAAAAVFQQVFGSTITDLARNEIKAIDYQAERISVIRATHTSEDGFDLLMSKEVMPVVRQALVDAGAAPLNDETFETLRIEAGIARHGRDIDETNVVTETNLDDAVSFTKGCYIGQEIIVRIKHRGHVAKKLTGIMFDRSVDIQSGAQIKSTDGKEIGRITSATNSPALGKTVALGFVRFEYLTSGTDVVVDAAGELVAAKVHDLPFIRGSWYA